jgi:hypothetical protein
MGQLHAAVVAHAFDDPADVVAFGSPELEQRSPENHQQQTQDQKEAKSYAHGVFIRAEMGRMFLELLPQLAQVAPQEDRETDENSDS